MKSFGKFIIFIWHTLIVLSVANAVLLANQIDSFWYLAIAIPYFIYINIYPNLFNRALLSAKLRNSANGCEFLENFLVSTFVSIVLTICAMVKLGFVSNAGMWTGHIVLLFIVECIVFWNGIIRIYLSSAQLGIKWRVIGGVCGMIPIVHLVVLGILLNIVHKEINFENNKIRLNTDRKSAQICKTKYPILMVHGVFFRDYRYLNYWGRIPKELEDNGATVFYGNHQSAASVKNSGKEIADRIKEIIKETGCEKVNIIAHSKGGLDSRFAISKYNMDEYVASLTTINTPHRGCEFADYLLSKIGDKEQAAVAKMYNGTLKKLGDYNPDFLAAVYDLTHANCAKLNEEVMDSDKVYYQSIGSKLNVARGGRFPLNFSYHLVNYFDGYNDGLVGEKSFPWGYDYRFLTVNGKRGISHGDMIDLNRENIDEFDVREFYVQLVAGLKDKGM